MIFSALLRHCIAMHYNTIIFFNVKISCMKKHLLIYLLTCLTLGDNIPFRNKSNNKYCDNSVGRCMGKTPCTACSDCSRCRYCTAGGSCGICATKTVPSIYKNSSVATKKQPGCYRKPVQSHYKKRNQVFEKVEAAWLLLAVWPMNSARWLQ